jgi:hypothetical protein
MTPPLDLEYTYGGAIACTKQKVQSDIKEHMKVNMRYRNSR